LSCKGAKDRDIAAISRRIVTLWRTAHLRNVRFIHEFSHGDAAADGFCIFGDLMRLIRSPHSGGVAGSGGDGKRSYKVSVGGVREIDNALPLLASEHAIESLWRRGWRGVIGVLKVSRVCPGTADTQIRRPECRGQLEQTRIGEIDRRPVLKHR
jgi:hypothetical protein